MGKLNNIDHSLLESILNNKLAEYSEVELQTPEERAEKMGIPFDADPNRNPLFTTADEDTLLDRINNKYRK